MDFVMDALATGRRIKCLTCVDDYTKEGGADDFLDLQEIIHALI
jgi:hypothetical protein